MRCQNRCRARISVVLAGCRLDRRRITKAVGMREEKEECVEQVCGRGVWCVNKSREVMIGSTANSHRGQLRGRVAFPRLAFPCVQPASHCCQILPLSPFLVSVFVSVPYLPRIAPCSRSVLPKDSAPRPSHLALSAASRPSVVAVSEQPLSVIPHILRGALLNHTRAHRPCLWLCTSGTATSSCRRTGARCASNHFTEA